MTKRTIKIIGIILVVLWFGGNLGLYVYLKYFLKYEIKIPCKKGANCNEDNEFVMQLASREGIDKAFTFIPEKITLSNSKIETDSLYFFNYKLNFPYYYMKDIRKVFLSFNEGKEHGLENFLVDTKNDNIAAISFSNNNFSDDVDSLREMIFWEKAFVFFYKNKPYQREAYYSRLNDYSVWNLPYNIKLIPLLLYKAAMLDACDNVYDVKTPYIEGFFCEMTSDRKTLYSYDFEIRNNNYSISFLKSENKREVMEILASIQPVNDIEASYKATKNAYDNKGISNFPEELLLLSMISMKGTNLNDLRELLNVMKEKNYHETIINDVKKEIESLRVEQ